MLMSLHRELVSSVSCNVNNKPNCFVINAQYFIWVFLNVLEEAQRQVLCLVQNFNRDSLCMQASILKTHGNIPFYL